MMLRDDEVPVTVDEERVAIYRTRQRKALPAFVAILLYPFLLGWIWKQAAYPESFGIHPGLGKGGIYLRWWDSYHLLERHHFWDIMAFIGMWPGVIVLIVWTMRSIPKTKEISAVEEAAYSSHKKGGAR